MENKYLEYYLDSKVYDTTQVKKSIEDTVKEFPNKNVKANVKLNEFGIYIVTFEFENKETVFNKIQILLKNKKQQIHNLNEYKYKNKTQSSNEYKYKNQIQNLNEYKYENQMQNLNKFKEKIQNLSKNIVEYSKKTRSQKKQEKLQKRFDKYSGKDIFYGQYKSTGIYRPY